MRQTARVGDAYGCKRSYALLSLDEQPPRLSQKYSSRGWSYQSSIETLERWQERLIIVVVSVGSVLAFFYTVPFHQPFGMAGVAIYDLQQSCAGISTVAGTSVNFVWHAPAFTYFAVVSCSENTVAYEGNGTSGSGTFVSTGGIYEFGSLCAAGPCVPADVIGTYTGPTLNL